MRFRRTFSCKSVNLVLIAGDKCIQRNHATTYWLRIRRKQPTFKERKKGVVLENSLTPDQLKDKKKAASVQRTEKKVAFENSLTPDELGCNTEKKREANRAGERKQAALPKEAPQRAKRAHQQNTHQSQITALPNGAPSKKGRALQQKLARVKNLLPCLRNSWPHTNHSGKLQRRLKWNHTEKNVPSSMQCIHNRNIHATGWEWRKGLRKCLLKNGPSTHPSTEPK